MKTRICLVGLAVCLLLAGVVLIARQRALFQTTVVSYTPLTGEADWEGEWQFSEQGANPSEGGSQTGDDRVAISFVGTELALQVRRGDYRGYFFVTVDGEPANRLPRNERGAYLVLTSPDYTPQVVTIPVAGGLDDGPHVAVVVAERGWDQWPLAGWRVSRVPDTTAHRWLLVGLGVMGAACLVGIVWQVGSKWQEAGSKKQGTGGKGQISCVPHPARDGSVFAAVIISAAIFYFSPWLSLTVVSGLALAVLVLLRLDLGLALVALTAPFYLRPRSLLGWSFSMVEITALLCALSWGGRLAVRWWKEAKNKCQKAGGKKQEARSILHPVSYTLNSASALDLAALAFVLVALASFFVAEYRHVALRELRVLILEPALFYLILRTTRLDRRMVWRLVDCFVIGGVVIALLGLVQYTFSDVAWVREALGDVIRAEHGFHRLRSIYGSPNSVGLYLGRVLPLLAAVVLFGRSRGRRVAYGLAVLPLGLAVLLSFSKGALILGVPLSLVALGMLAGGRWFWTSIGAVIVALATVIPLLQTPRFASLLDTQSGTTFFRLSLWLSSWAMFRDHPALGVGPDNFLYQYRGRYILPGAWQEPNISQAHNILLDYGTRMGIVGLAVGAWLQIAFWQVALPLRRLTDPDRRALALGVMASMVNFVAHGLVDASYFLVDLAFAFFLTLGVVQWLSRSESNGNQDQP